MPYQWFKFYGMEYLSDPKIMGLGSAKRSCWVTLLSLASLNDGVVEFLPEQQLMLQAGVDFQSDEWNKTVGIYDHFKKLRMVEIQEEKIIIINWKKRQESNLTGYERVKRHREKKRNDNAMITLDKNRIEKNRKETTVAARPILKKENDNTDFEKWWKLYPNKVGKDKALKAWQRIKPDLELKRKMATAVIEHIKSDRWTRDDGGFIPHPTTWINQKRWEEVLPKPKEKPKKPHYQGMPIVIRFGKRYCLKDGEWFEFAGKEEDIEML